MARTQATGAAETKTRCTASPGGSPEALAALVAALADPLRLQILDLLATGRSGPCCSPVNPQAPVAVCACDISADLGGLAPSKLAYHLGLLREANVLLEQRKGKWVYYSLNRPLVAQLLDHVASRWLLSTETQWTPRDPAKEPKAMPERVAASKSVGHSAGPRERPAKPATARRRAPR